MDNASAGLEQPLAVVTGASSGIGLELARQFAQNGFDLIIVAEDAGILRAAEELRIYGVNVDPYEIDLAHYKGVELLGEKIEATGRALAAIAINAGVGVGGDFAHTSLNAELNMIQLNVISAVHLAKRVIPAMVERRQGRILFTSSIAGTMPGPFYAVYAASKAFIQSFAIAIRDELKDTGVTVTSLMPGATDTNFFRRAHMEDTKAGMAEKDDPAVVAEDGFKALMDGRDHVVAGAFTNALQSTIVKVLPETFTAKMQRRQVEPQPHRKH